MTDQGELFPMPVSSEPEAPLATRMRPKSFEDLVGQREVVDVLRQLTRSGHLPSIVLWGPPGSGKTTLAGLLATETRARMVALSAVTAGVADLRKVVAEAKVHRRAGMRTVLFVDEIHRFNKAQQDAILPHVEEGTVTLIGATTENPSFEVIAPLLSRSRVFRLEQLDRDELKQVVERGLQELGAAMEHEAMEDLLETARGDARVALNGLEAAAALAGEARIGVDHVERAMQQRHLLYDRAGDQHYDIVSALIKSVRGSDPDAAVYYLAAMLEAGEDARFIARRMIVLASEDIGNADPRALLVAVAAAQAVEHVGLPEARLNLSQAAIYLARAPKSNASYMAINRASADVRERGAVPPPKSLRDGSWYGRKLGHGEGYIYPHNDPRGAEMSYLPEELQDRTYYEPSGNGEETSEQPR